MYCDVCHEYSLYQTIKNVNKEQFFPEFPSFLAKPSPDVTVLERDNVTLPCKVAGYPQPVITWYKNDDVIQGEGSQFLKIKEIQFEDRGNYTCTAENLLGTARLSFKVTVKGW